MADPFAELSEEWFRNHGSISDPTAAAEEWRRWLTTRRSDEAKYRKVLELGSGRSIAAICYYCNGRGRKLSDKTWTLLDRMTRALGRVPPEKKQNHKSGPHEQGPRRIALLSELSDIPSPSFHFEVIRSVVRGTSRARVVYPYETSIHELPRSGLSVSLGRILRVYQPDAVVMVRLSPDPESLEILAEDSIPTILVHANRYKYPTKPVLTNIVPDQGKIPDLLRLWANQHIVKPGPQSGDVVVVAMAREEEERWFEPLDGAGGSIRNERIDLVMSALDDHAPVLHTVKDYTARRALDVFEKHPGARAYVCLSDEIAVALRHLRRAAARKRKDRCEIIGFDDSQLAREEGITSIGQSLHVIGERAAGKFDEWFRRRSDRQNPWDDIFSESKIDAYLKI
jgi:DNA-binding LacI/PurR family transcriptional regulator